MPFLPSYYPLQEGETEKIKEDMKLWEAEKIRIMLAKKAEKEEAEYQEMIRLCYS